MTSAASSPTPKVGQVWRDNDPRMSGRYVRLVEIVKIEAGFAFCKPLSENVKRRSSQTRIHLSRFRPTSTGYVLERDVVSEETPS